MWGNYYFLFYYVKIEARTALRIDASRILDLIFGMIRFFRFLFTKKTHVLFISFFTSNGYF